MNLTHIDENNNPTMVDVSEKEHTNRSATAESKVILPKEIATLIDKNGEITLKKGPVIQTAIIAGTMAAKKTSELIPFCHPLNLTSIKVNIEQDIHSQNTLIIHCSVKLNGQTGVEMEALTGASIAALTIYDMCKALSHEINIDQTRLISKTGGKRNIVDGKLCD